MVRSFHWFILFSAVAFVLAGCGQPSNSGTPVGQLASSKTAAGTATTKHDHKEGQHGGLIAAIGLDDRYHAEVIFEKGGVVKVYTLGPTGTEVERVEVQKLEAHAQAEGATDGFPVELHPVRQKRDPAGKTSAFMGKLPPELLAKAVTLTVPITIDGKDYRFRVVSRNTGHEEPDNPMPGGLTDAKEKELYLTPGGKYTDDDIKANGTMTASEKFKGLKANHDMRPKAGDRVCPITMTKANPSFTWIVNGQAYQFCCPPCVDEFVQMAKEQPAQLKAPEEYIKK
jgi:hypothetical protein